MTDNLLRDRVELKYALLPEEAGELLGRLDGDRELAGSGRRDGRVTTVYLDRPDGAFRSRARRSPTANLKLRLREYLDPETSRFVWIEVKERDGQSSRKRRFRLHRRLIDAFLSGTLDVATVLTCQGPGLSVAETVEAFERIAGVSGGPLVVVGAVRYRRRSFDTPEARLTLDQEIAYHRGPLDSGGASLRCGPALWEEPAVVIEVKHRAGRPPRWAPRLLGRFVPAEYSKFLTLTQLAAPEPVAVGHVD